jgi:hypothetical protein
MRQLIVQYRVKPDRSAENQQLINAVFEELNQTNPAGLHYAAFKQSDGVTFVHIASLEGSENPLSKSPAFQAFQAGIRERCDVLPVAADMAEVGSYQF